MTYDIFVHKHNFAIWAAARATQRGFADVATLRDAIEQCGVVEFLKTRASLSVKKDAFEALHRIWCGKIRRHLVNQGLRGSTYGRAAKLLAVYLKSMVIVGGNDRSAIATVIHPPIDRILLQNLSRAKEIDHPNRLSWRKLNWTQLEKKEYYNLIAQLSSCLPAGAPFWTLERYWTVAVNG